VAGLILFDDFAWQDYKDTQVVVEKCSVLHFPTG